MTTWFVSRHPGAKVWAENRKLAIDRHVSHLDPASVQVGDIVIGTLPVNLAAEVCARGAHYCHLSLRLPAELRGVELTAEQLEQLDTRLTAYEIRETPLPEEIET